MTYKFLAFDSRCVALVAAVGIFASCSRESRFTHLGKLVSEMGAERLQKWSVEQIQNTPYDPQDTMKEVGNPPKSQWHTPNTPEWIRNKTGGWAYLTRLHQVERYECIAFRVTGGHMDGEIIYVGSKDFDLKDLKQPERYREYAPSIWLYVE